MKKNLLSGAAIAVLSWGFASSAVAADINVSTTADLKAAVGAAQDGDVIRIAAGTYLLDSEIDVNNKTISLVGMGNVVLDGQKQVRVMNVHANANATVENLIIRNGFVSDGGNNKGAGIRVDGGSLTVTNCKFIDNIVDYQAAGDANWTGGAGIHGNNTKLVITNAEFIGGKAYQGGAITLQNTDIDAKNVLFEGNKTLFDGKKDGAKGGAICVRSDNGTVHTHNFDHCVFKENIAWGNGGALSYNVSGGAAGQNTTFNGCSFIRNTTNVDLDNLARTADNDGMRGGAVFIDTDGKFKVNFLSCTIAQNVAALGGGAIALIGFKNKGADQEARFVNCTITANHNLDNSGNGAGVWINENNNCGGISFVNTILTGNWSVKVNDENYAEDVEKNEAWKHWEYSDLTTTGSTNQDLIAISNTVVGFMNNAEKYTGEYPNLTVQRETQAWVEGETEEAQLGELAEYDEDYFAYPFSISAMTWLDDELGDMDLAREYGCATDQFGVEWEVNCIGAVQFDDIENYSVPVFFDESKIGTGIANITSGVKTAGGAVYTLSGVRVAKPAAKGVYIRDGKKIVIK